MWFKKKVDESKVNNDSVNPETKLEEDEWVIVEGYKGTDKDMKCLDYQYSLGTTFTMPNGSSIDLCESGFHLCKDLGDVYQYYPVRDGNRFFKVKALVRKENLDGYYTRTVNDGDYLTCLYGYRKLVAAQITFLEELTPDDILKDFTDISEWTDDDKKMAMNFGVVETRQIVERRMLVSLGYVEPLADYIVSSGRYTIAKAVGSQTDLSMDMKCLIIFKEQK